MRYLVSEMTWEVEILLGCMQQHIAKNVIVQNTFDNTYIYSLYKMTVLVRSSFKWIDLQSCCYGGRDVIYLQCDGAYRGDPILR